MNAKKRNILTLVLLVAVGAVLARLTVKNLKPQDPRLLGDPNQVVVETRYSSDWHKKLGVRRGPTQLFELPRGLGWHSGGGTAEDVKNAFGLPQYEVDFMDEDYFVWKENVRYDWDLENKFAGHYLSISFRYNGGVQNVTITKDLPPGASPVEQGTNPLPEVEDWDLD